MDEGTLETIRTRLEAPGGPVGEELMKLRAEFPGLRFVVAEAADVIEAPLVSGEGFDLHLIDVRDHCVKMTHRMESAGGVLVAFRKISSKG